MGCFFEGAMAQPQVRLSYSIYLVMGDEWGCDGGLFSGVDELRVANLSTRRLYLSHRFYGGSSHVRSLYFVGRDYRARCRDP